jgi:hypothetical protein
MESEPILEAILQNQDENAGTTNDLLEKVLEVTADNNHEDLLDKQLEVQAETLDTVKKMAENPLAVDIKVNGADTVGYTGPEGKQGVQGEMGPEPTDERLIALITPLIPEPKDGKDADEEVIIEKILEEITPMIPTPEAVALLVPRPKDGKNGEKGQDGVDGKQGKAGKDGSPDTPKQVKDKLLKEGLSYKELKDTPDVDFLEQRIQKVSSKTVSLRELDDVNLTGLTQTNGKYDLGNGSSGGTWTTYVPTITGVTSNPTKGTVTVDQASYFVLGKMMTINYFYKQTALGAAGSGAYKFSIPAGYTVDTTKLTTYSSQSAGYANNIGATVVGTALVNNGSQGLPSIAFVGDSTNIVIGIYIAINDMRLISDAIIALSGATVQYSFSVTIPII